MADRIFWGLTGYSGTGKTTVAEHFASKGFAIIEGSTLIREAAAE
jgi:dephospho-CoA kinase